MKKRIFSLIMVLAMIIGLGGALPEDIVFAYSFNGNIYNNGLGGIYIDISDYPYNSLRNGTEYGPTGCAWFVSCRAKQFNDNVNTIWSAKNWLNRAGDYGFTVDNTPSAGSIMCWTTGNVIDGVEYGHVAFLEKIEGNTAYISEGGTSYIVVNNNKIYLNDHSYCHIYTVSVSSMTSKKDGGGNYMTFGGYVHVGGSSGPRGEIIKPTITTNKNTYVAGETVKVSWAASPANSNLSHYWINVSGPGVSIGQRTDKNTSYSFVVPQEGTYSIMTYATPYGSASGEGSLTDTKSIKVTAKGAELTTGAGQTIPDGDYWIYNNASTTAFLDINGVAESADNGTNVAVWATDEVNVVDAFHIEYLGNSFYKITQYNTNQSLDVAEYNMASGANIQIWKYAGSEKNQQWSIEKTENGFKIRSRWNGYYLDVEGGIPSAGKNAVVEKQSTSASQEWSFVPIGKEIKTGAGQTIPDGYYWIYNKANTAAYLDINGIAESAANGTNVAVWSPEEPNLVDAFHIEYLGNSFYKITQYNTNQSLDVEDYNLAFGANIQIWKYAGSEKNQQWSIEKTKNGYKIRSRWNGYYLDVKGGIPKNGTNVVVERQTSSDSQEWIFVNINGRLPGDVNSDKEVNIKDVTILKQSLAKWNVEINESNANVNGDNDVTVKDVTLLCQKLANWNVELI